MYKVTRTFPLRLVDLKECMKENVYNSMCEFLNVENLSDCDSISVGFNAFDRCLIFKNSFTIE